MSLAQHLAQQSVLLTRFIALLEAEQHCLAQGRIDSTRLQTLATDKQALLNEIDRMERQRQHALQRLGYGDDSRDSARAADDAGCPAAWQRLLELATRARLLNRLNGETIRTRLAHNQRILNFLHEATGKGTYGSDGQARRGSLGNIRTQA